MQCNIADGGTLLSLPEESADQGIETDLPAVIEELTDLERPSRDVAPVVAVGRPFIGGVLRCRFPFVILFLAPRRGGPQRSFQHPEFPLLEEQVQDVVGLQDFAEQRCLFLLYMDGIGGKEIGMVFLGLPAVSGLDAAGLDVGVQKILADVDIFSEELLAGLHHFGLGDRIHYARNIYRLIGDVNRK